MSTVPAVLYAFMTGMLWMAAAFLADEGEWGAAAYFAAIALAGAWMTWRLLRERP